LKKVAVLQSNYIPWKGYFDLIAYVDEFIIYDDMQFTKRDWRNRNKIKTPTGLQWLSVPVLSKGKFHQKINETRIDGNQWQKDHWNALTKNYSRAHFFEEISKWLKPLYLERDYSFLSDLNLTFIDEICSYLNIKTKISSSSDYDLTGDKTERLVNLCKQTGATEYISGPAAKAYLDVSILKSSEIQLSWFDYNGYRPYPQLWGIFTNEVSILDMLFNCGKNTTKFMKQIQPSNELC
jgi:hypothetical protein